MIFETEGNKDIRRFNAPVANEVAFVFRNNDGEPPANRDLKAYRKVLNIPLTTLENNNYQTISVNTTMNICEPMCYPLLYPYGEKGWDMYLKQTGLIFIYI